MGANFAKIALGMNFKPQPTSAISSPSNGDVYYDSTRNTLVEYINGQWTDNQSRTDVTSVSSMTSTTFTAAVVQSTVARITGSTSGNIHGLVASSDAKAVLIYNQSSVLQTLKNQSATEGTAANRILTPSGADITLLSGQSATLIYDASQSRWIVVGISSSGSGSGTKNYLSTVTTSQSSTPNTGNGNFELGSTVGWSLGTTGTLTNGLPTGSPTFGSGASGNLSISTVNSGQLAGMFSLSYASSAATTVGNMLASDAFNIDSEDQAKVLTWKFCYKAQTNPANANWSGTSSNSFGVAIWDVTNSQWLGTTANFGMTQNAGVGIVSGTVQTNLSTAQMRLVVYNINATTGAVTLYFDDFSIGPQVVQIGAVITDLVSWTPTFQGFGTVTNISAFSRRVGSNLEGFVTFTAGTVTATTALVSLGFNGQNANVTMSTVLNASGNIVGHWVRSGTTSTEFNFPVLASSGGGNLGFGITTAALNGLSTENGSTIIASNETVSLYFNVPITGWSSNTQMSNDTDTRVVAFNAGQQTPTGTISGTNNIIKFGTVTNDTHGSYNTTTGLYTVPVTGWYQVSSTIEYSFVASAGGQFVRVQINRNAGSPVATGVYTAFGSATQPAIVTATGISYFNAGDTIGAYSFANAGTATFTTTDSGCYFSINRLSGPSAIAASETVAARYVNSSTAVTSSFATITYSTKDYDTHNAYSGGVYTIPVAGKYKITASVIVGDVSGTHQTGLQILKNGGSNAQCFSSGGPTGIPAAISSDTVVTDCSNCVAGDTIAIQCSDNGTTPSITSSPQRVIFHIFRIGN